MPESMTVITTERVNSAVLVSELAPLSVPFSMAAGRQDDGRYFVRITTDALLSAEDGTLAQSIIAAHDPKRLTAEQLRVAKVASALADVSIADVRALINAYDSASTAVQIKAALRPILVLLLKAAVASGSMGFDQVVDIA